MRPILILGALVCLTVSTASAQDPVKVDPKHYKVEFENAQVRVLRSNRGPHEKSPMHEHPAYVAVPLTDIHLKLTFPDGRTEERHAKAGEVRWSAGAKHAEENVGDKAAEAILVELKAKPAVAKPAAKKGGT